MKRFLYPTVILALMAVTMYACTGQNTTTSSEEPPEAVFNRDWVHAYWLAPEPQRVYIPYSDEEFDERITDGLRINDDSIYLQYVFQRDGSRSTEIGNWIWLPDGNTFQVTFENDKEAVNYRVISVSPERLEVEVIPD